MNRDPQMRLRVALVVMGIAMVTAPGCRRETAVAPPATPVATPKSPPMQQDGGMPRVDPAVAAAVVEAAQERQVRRRFRDCLVFVDGRPAGVLKFRELPPDLAPTILDRGGGKKTIRFSLYNYVASLGVDMARLKAVHLHGGRSRTVVIRSDVLAAHKDDLLFQFTQQVTGKPRMAWPTGDVDVNTRVDMLTEISIFVDRDPPAWSDERGAYLLADGGTFTGAPYAPDKDVGGTRVYADGALLSFMRRPHVDGDREETTWSLGEFLAANRADPRKFRTLELVDMDQTLLVVPLTGNIPAGIRFGFPSHNQGRARFHIPGGPDGGLGASAVNLWSGTEPRAVVIPPGILQPRAPLPADVMDGGTPAEGTAP